MGICCKPPRAITIQRLIPAKIDAVEREVSIHLFFVGPWGILINNFALFTKKKARPNSIISRIIK